MSVVTPNVRWPGAIPRWKMCPSTHCERSQECRAPHECSGTGKRLIVCDRCSDWRLPEWTDCSNCGGMVTRPDEARK